MQPVVARSHQLLRPSSLGRIGIAIPSSVPEGVTGPTHNEPAEVGTCGGSRGKVLFRLSDLAAGVRRIPIAYRTMRIVRCNKLGAASIILATSSGAQDDGQFPGIFGKIRSS